MAYIITFGQELNASQLAIVKKAAAEKLEVSADAIKVLHKDNFLGTGDDSAYLQTVIPSFQAGNIVMLYNLTKMFPDEFSAKNSNNQWLYHTFQDSRLDFSKISNVSSLADFHQHMIALDEWRRTNWSRIWSKSGGKFGKLDAPALAKEGITAAMAPKLTWANGNYNFIGITNEMLRETNATMTYSGQLKVDWKSSKPTMVAFVKEITSKNNQPYWFVKTSLYFETAEVKYGVGGGTQDMSDELDLFATAPVKPDVSKLTEAEVQAKIQQMFKDGSISFEQLTACGTDINKMRELV